MKLFRNILLSLLLLTNVGYTQNNLIKSGNSLLKIGNNLIATPLFNQYSFIHDGVDEYININSVQTALASTTKGTFSCWIKPVDATVGLGMFISFGDINVNTSIILYINSAALVVASLTLNGTSQWHLATDLAVFSDNTWTYVALVQDGTEPVLYINGAKPNQAFIVSTNKTRWFNDLSGLDNGRLGARNHNNLGNIQHFNGNIDEVSTWDTDLTLTEIQEIYNNGKPNNLKGHSAVANLIGWFRMGDGDTFDGSNWTLFDNANSNNGTSVNMEFSDRTQNKP